MRKALALLPLCFVLTACDKVSSTFSTGAPSKAPAATVSYDFEVNTTSPDQALKTWWRYLDTKSAISLARCEAYARDHADDFNVAKVAMGEIEQSLNSRKSICARSIYEREILEVKQETGTRAVALVKITNATPSSASRTLEDEKRRNRGERFKYLIENTGEGWKVSQVYQYDDTSRYTGGSDWPKQYTPYIETYQTYVFGNQ
ncbi:hypothetical protein [Pseudomonas putida]|uniref:hypothetical protein n=1 Tax=Pseudomonas putida TaxID=303 RepID=UPI0018D6E8B9|nr:hypothetical protein [Pseudomonas putida]MBH3409857.1 hypothetical protein [Pseudomonas putida]